MEKKSSIVPIDLGVLAYVVGLAIGDGNLSNPNGRAIRLRITCHVRYQSLIQSISQTIQALLPKNKVSIIKRSKNYLDISCYSNQWEKMTMLSKLGFRASISSFASKNEKHRLKHTIRICQNAEKLIEVLGLSKA